MAPRPDNAKAQYAPLNRLQDPDPETRTHRARVIAGTCGAGQSAYVTFNNKVEGAVPLSVTSLGKNWIRAKWIIYKPKLLENVEDLFRRP